jgi:hypothetical protein
VTGRGRPPDGTVAFDTLLTERLAHRPCLRCHQAPEGYYVIWSHHATGLVVVVPVCATCQHLPDIRLWLDAAMARRYLPDAST